MRDHSLPKAVANTAQMFLVNGKFISFWNVNKIFPISMGKFTSDLCKSFAIYIDHHFSLTQQQCNYKRYSKEPYVLGLG